MLLALRLLLAAVFATAGVAKLLDRDGSRQALEDFGMPARLAPAGGIALPLAELAIAVALLIAPTAQWGAIGAIVLLLLFVAGIGAALARGEAPDCHCFGQVHSEPAGKGTLVRNGVLAALAAVVAVAGPGPSITGWISDRSAPELVIAAAAVAGALALALLLRKRWERRQEQLAQEEADRRKGLPVGAPAPEFELAGLDGERTTLETLRGRGRPVLLLFTHPNCPPCKEMLPEIVRWQRVLADRLTIAVLSDGPPEEQDAYREHELQDLLLQVGMTEYYGYRMPGTPSGVVVSEDGRIDSVPAVGGLMVEELIRVALQRTQPASPPATPVAA